MPKNKVHSWLLRSQSRWVLHWTRSPHPRSLITVLELLLGPHYCRYWLHAVSYLGDPFVFVNGHSWQRRSRYGRALLNNIVVPIRPGYMYSTYVRLVIWDNSGQPVKQDGCDVEKRTPSYHSGDVYVVAHFQWQSSTVWSQHPTTRDYDLLTIVDLNRSMDVRKNGQWRNNK